MIPKLNLVSKTILKLRILKSEFKIQLTYEIIFINKENNSVYVCILIFFNKPAVF